MTVAVVGASGAVGQEILKILEQRNFKTDELVLFGSQRSVGRECVFRGEKIKIRLLEHGDAVLRSIDLFFTSAGSDVAKAYKDEFISNGAYMIDNSSAFRMEESVPLIIPEINISDLHKDLYAKSRVIANPNCSTIMMALPLFAIHNLSPIKSIHVATYQAASGIGWKGMDELEQQVNQLAQHQSLSVSAFPHQLAYNVFPHVDSFLLDGYTGEEKKMSDETQKIFNAKISISATCVRVPVMRCHSECVWVETEKSISVEDVRSAIESMPGCVLQDDIEHAIYPMPITTSLTDDIHVGRIRKDTACQNGIAFWCVGDQLRKGAALNAVQIAEKLTF